MVRHACVFALGLCSGGVVPLSSASAQTVILYENDFEQPNMPLVVNCGNSLDTRGINVLYGSADFKFDQQRTVEAVFLHDPAGKYSNSGEHGEHALGMLSTREDDKLALAFNSQSHPYINVGLDLSPIDVNGCGGPFGVSAPKLRITLLDRPDGKTDYSQTELDRQEVVGLAAPDGWSFRWKSEVVGLSTRGSHDGKVTVVFDLLEGGYAVFDNLSIAASMASRVVDRDLDKVADDTDNCLEAANRDQADSDGDGAGDACDPAPHDGHECGDRDDDGVDDCSGQAVAPPDARQESRADAPRLDAGTNVHAKPSSDSTARAGRGSTSARDSSLQREPETQRVVSCGCTVPGGNRGRGGALVLALGCVSIWRARSKRRSST
jgi:hypothetical protein